MRKIFVLMALLPLLAFSLSAQVSGKISGRVVDKQTGESLPGANIVIEGTTMGAASDLDGYYFIINVPVGEWTVKASMMGYNPVTIENVRVSVGLTTTLNFELGPTIIEVEGVTVTAERPLVLPDATATIHISRGEEIERQPIATYQDAISQQAGVLQSDGGSSGVTDGIHIRGGRGDEVAYMVDGMSTTDRLTGRAGAGVDININAIEEMQVITGGFNAEYGQAMSGVVNLITKEGRGRQEGLIRYRTDVPFGGNLDEGRHRVETNMGGPFPGIRNLRYFLSAEISNRERLQAYDFPMQHTEREFLSTQGKFSYKFSPSMKLNLSGFYSRDQGGRYGVWAGTPMLNKPSAGSNDFKYAPDQYRFSRLAKDAQVMASFTHQLSNRTFYEAKVGYYSTSTITGQRDAAYEKDRKWWEDIKFRYWWECTEGDYPDYRGVWWDMKYWDEEKGDSVYYYPHGVPGFFSHGAPCARIERESSYYGFDWDLTSQLSPHHQVRTGIEGRRYDVRRLSLQYIDRTSGRVAVIDEDGNFLGNEIAPEFRKPGFVLYSDDYQEEPIEIAGYIQDKIEYPGFIVNAGVRFDYFDSHTWRYVDITKPYKTAVVDGDTVLVPDTVSAEAKYQVSPRFGISFPVTDMTVFHLSYGHFFQMAQLRWLYDSYNADLRTYPGGWPLLGNPDLEAQRTIQYEMGLSHQFTHDIAFDIVGFYKDIYNLIGSRLQSASPKAYTVYITEDYGNCKGVEFTLRKRATEGLSGHISYTLSDAKGTSSYEREAYYDYIANIRPDPYTGERPVLPKIDYPLEFDQRHTISLNLAWLTSHGSGPIIGGGYPLEDMSIGFVSNLGSGLPYTRRDATNNLVGETNAERMPWTWTTDMKIGKDISLFGLGMVAFLEVTNLFDLENISNVYATNGNPRDPGLLQSYGEYITSTFNNIPAHLREEDRVQVGVTGAADVRRDFDGDGYITKEEWYQSYKNAYYDYVNEPTYIGHPRHISIGVSFNW
ncbi:hypothetical protein CH333_03820 [candidate division WOR-3 bacterium JGI_Cruoil_03_44_89]|uniref:EF-hand domain-containing protein n=1 Tax=candidate division WOR-3 bacterium JGI_Cruoil_03_44_89 TaxID=1973748 RepID=A0A235BV30_UNCW3|nr:MAG: hypothetical protein CH333_03820 [candidate division WOR-3 bacterium JGI_Cruoil_03_44_89]